MSAPGFRGVKAIWAVLGAQAHVGSGEKIGDFGDGVVGLGIGHEGLLVGTTHNDLRFAADALSGRFGPDVFPCLLTIYAGVVESVRFGLPESRSGSQ